MEWNNKKDFSGTKSLGTNEIQRKHMIINMYEGRETNIIACMLRSHTMGGGGRATCGRKSCLTIKPTFVHIT